MTQRPLSSHCPHLLQCSRKSDDATETPRAKSTAGAFIGDSGITLAAPMPPIEALIGPTSSRHFFVPFTSRQASKKAHATIAQGKDSIAHPWLKTPGGNDARFIGSQHTVVPDAVKTSLRFTKEIQVSA